MPVARPTERVPGPILVAVNFSPACEAALLAGARLADAEPAPLLIVHTVHASGARPGSYYRRRPDDIRPISAIAAEMFDDFLNRIAAAHPERAAIGQADRVLLSGLPGPRILELAERVGAQRIMVGWHVPQRGILGDLWNGSVGGWLSRHSGIPVSRVELESVA